MKQKKATLGGNESVHAPKLPRMRELLRDLQALRKASGLNQTEFWRKYGATQSAGSRYESGRIPAVPTLLLMVLEVLGHVDQTQLVEAVRIVEELRRNSASGR